MSTTRSCSTGGGTGLIGMWKAFAELRTLGWLESKKLPKMVAVQSDGCAPIPRAFDAGERFAAPWQDAATCASGLRVPGAVGDFMILDAVRESGGEILTVDDDAIRAALHQLAAAGIWVEPTAAVALAGHRSSGGSEDDAVVTTGHGLKTAQ